MYIRVPVSQLCILSGIKITGLMATKAFVKLTLPICSYSNIILETSWEITINMLANICSLQTGQNTVAASVTEIKENISLIIFAFHRYQITSEF